MKKKMSDFAFKIMANVDIPIRSLFMPPSKMLAEVEINPGYIVLDCSKENHEEPWFLSCKKALQQLRDRDSGSLGILLLSGSRSLIALITCFPASAAPGAGVMPPAVRKECEPKQRRREIT